MNTNTCAALAVAPAPPDIFTPSVLLAYEDYITGTYAVRILNHFALRHGLPSDFGTHNAWKFEILSLPALRNISAMEAAAADLVVLSAHGFDRLPGFVLDWVELWLSWRAASPAAIVALVDDNNSPSVENYLDRCAREKGMILSVHLVGPRSGSDDGVFGMIANEPENMAADIDQVVQKLAALRAESSIPQFAPG